MTTVNIDVAVLAGVVLNAIVNISHAISWFGACRRRRRRLRQR